MANVSIASDLRLTKQARTVLRHLKRHRRITPMKALVIYNISRLAPCIYEIRHRAGYTVHTKMVKDDVGHKFADYRLSVN